MKLYLHCGSFKTGTTALQYFGHDNREELLKRGLYYADYGDAGLPLRGGHHQFAHAIAREEPGAYEHLAKIVRHWRSVAKAEGVPVLISTETVTLLAITGDWQHWRGRVEFLKRLASLLEPFEVEAIIVYRRPDDFARSLYQERVANGFMRLPDFPEWLTLPHPMLEYSKNASLIDEAFASSLHLLYEELTDGPGLYENFFDHLGVSLYGLAIPHVVRKSLTPAETVIKNYANNFISKKNQGQRFIRWMREQGLADELEQVHSQRLSLWCSAHERNNFLALRHNDLSSLRAKFFPKRASSLFSAPKDEGVYQVPQVPHSLMMKVKHYFTEK